MTTTHIAGLHAPNRPGFRRITISTAAIRQYGWDYKELTRYGIVAANSRDFAPRYCQLCGQPIRTYINGAGIYPDGWKHGQCVQRVQLDEIVEDYNEHGAHNLDAVMDDARALIQNPDDPDYYDAYARYMAYIANERTPYALRAAADAAKLTLADQDNRNKKRLLFRTHRNAAIAIAMAAAMHAPETPAAARTAHAAGLRWHREMMFTHTAAAA